MEYLFFLLPVITLVIAYKYHIKHKKLLGSGKVTKIIDAKNMHALFMVISVMLVVLFVFYKNYDSL